MSPFHFVKPVGTFNSNIPIITLFVKKGRNYKRLIACAINLAVKGRAAFFRNQIFWEGDVTGYRASGKTFRRVSRSKAMWWRWGFAGDFSGFRVMLVLLNDRGMKPEILRILLIRRKNSPRNSSRRYFLLRTSRPSSFSR